MFGARVDFRKLKGVFRKTTAARPIRAVRAADRTAAKSRRRGHPEAAPWPHQIISLDFNCLLYVHSAAKELPSVYKFCT